MTAEEVDRLKREEIDLLRDENVQLCDKLRDLRSLVALLTGLLARIVRWDTLPADDLAEAQAAVSALLDLSEQTRRELTEQIQVAAGEVRE